MSNTVYNPLALGVGVLGVLSALGVLYLLYRIYRPRPFPDPAARLDPDRHRSGQPYRVGGYVFTGDRDGKRLRLRPTPGTLWVRVLFSAGSSLEFLVPIIGLLLGIGYLLRGPSPPDPFGIFVLSCIMLLLAAGAVGSLGRLVHREGVPWVFDRAAGGVRHGETRLCALQDISGVEITARRVWRRQGTFYKVRLNRSGGAAPLAIKGKAEETMDRAEVEAFAEEIARFVGVPVLDSQREAGRRIAEQELDQGRLMIRLKDTLTVRSAGRHAPDRGWTTIALAVAWLGTLWVVLWFPLAADIEKNPLDVRAFPVAARITWAGLLAIPIAVFCVMRDNRRRKRGGAAFLFDRALGRLRRANGVPIAALDDIRGLEADAARALLRVVLTDGRRILILSAGNRGLVEAVAREIADFLGRDERDFIGYRAGP